MSDEKNGSWDCTWEDIEAAQDRDAAAVPLWRKVQWLEEMHRMALRLEDQRAESRADGGAQRVPPDPGRDSTD